jgi:hypothetical protein
VRGDEEEVVDATTLRHRGRAGTAVADVVTDVLLDAALKQTDPEQEDGFLAEVRTRPGRRS